MKILINEQLGLLRNKTYVIEHNGKTILIDPSFKIARLLDKLEAEKINIDEVWLTHTHYDHIHGLEDTLKLYPNATVYAPPEELEFLRDKELNLSAGGRFEVEYMGEVLPFDEAKAKEEGIKIAYVSGHSLQSVVFIFEDEKIMITGDTIFKDAIGRSDLMFGNPQKLIQDIKDGILIYDEDYTLYPGHGDETTLLYEKENNINLR